MKTKAILLHVKIAGDMHERLKALGAEGYNQSALVRRFLAEGLDRMSK
jgi:hypothetical protein